MATIHAKAALDQVNANLVADAQKQAETIIGKIVNRQQQIKAMTAEIEDFKVQLSKIEVEPIEAGTIGL